MGQVNTGSAPDTYTINFYGVNVLYGDVKNEFEVTGTVSYSQGLDILTNPKRLFAGAQRQNLTGSLTRPTDVKVGSCRVFYDYIPNESIKMHAVDPTNFGTRHPYRDAFLYENDLRKSGIVEAETLALNWTFETVTGSNAAGQFLVPDLSSGSVDLQNRHGWISKIINLQHPGRGFGFPPDDINSVDKDYIFAYRQQLPEILTSEDTVKVLTQDDLQFTRESRPQTFFFALEKSMYQEISIEMLNLFSTVKDFGNLVGEPVNRYRQDYKDLSKLRQLYFEKVQNTPDFEKFVEFYKWFDESLNVFLQQFLPASADVSEEIKTVFESHILERNKYWTKFPTLEVKESDPDAGFRGVNELTYDWKTGHAPISDQENENCSWWNARAEREGIISSGDVAVDTDRGQILQATLSVLNRKFTTPHRFLTNRSLKLHSGINLPTNKRPDVSMINLQPSTSETIDITLDPLPDCIDGLNSPTRYGKKIRIPLIARGGMSGLAKSGDTVAPFSVFSSSAGNTTLAVAANKEITNLHHDGYGDFKEKPLQGPFTEKYVGGQQHRHVGLTTPIRTSTSSIPGFAAADYNQPMSHGDRTAEITVTYSPPFGAARQLLFEGALAPHFYSSLCLVDAVETISSCDGTFFNSGTPLAASYIRFDFGAGNKQRITELRWTQDRIDAQGQWKVQGSNDAIAWTDVSTVQTLGGGVDDSVYGAPYYSTPLSLDLIGATDTYRYYQLLYDNGVVVNAPDVSPVDFKISPRLLLYRLPNETERAEGFRLKVDSEIVSLMQPEKDSAGNINLNLPRARYYRDEVAKRPLNIRNIHQTTGSTIIGNYDEIYQVVQTSNRRANNQWWVDNETDVILYDENSFSLQTISPTPFAPCCVGPEIGWNDYAKPQRGKTPHVFVERFSSPGGPGTAGDSDGGVGLDVLSAEYSVYSTMNYRNTSVRQALNEFSTEHAAQFGVDPDDSTAAAFHKTNRNPLRKVELSGSTIITASIYDNFYIQHAIPQSDMGYAWITASAISAPLGYATDASKLVSNPETITFLSASDFGSFVFTAPSTQRALGGSLSILGYWAGLGVADPNSFIPTDFIGLNTNIYEPITSSDNFLGYPSFVEIAPWKYTYMGGEVVVLTEPPLGIGVATMLNNILLHRNGPYQYPMWKQIRTGEHPVARHQRNNNRIDYIIPAQADSLVPSLQGQVRRIIRPPVKKTFIEPALSSKHSPLRHTLLVDTTLEDDESENRTLIVRHTYGNNLGYFANVELNNNLKKMDGTLLEENPIRQVYNDITDLYIRSSADMERSNPVKKFISLRYRETVYPKEYNAFLNRTRSRTEYDVLSILKWNSVRATRAELGATNSQGQTLPPQTSSIWPVDGRFSGPETFDGLIPSAAPNSFINGRTLRLQSDDGITIDPLDPYYLTGLDGSGELLNDYVQFHRGDFTTIKPGVLYARRDTYYSESPAKVNSSVIYVTGDAKWEAPAQSGKKPFYDTYDDFADHIKRIGKDYSIVPEFRISDHLDYYMSSQGGNFLSSLPNNEFSVDGALLSSSAQSDNIENRKFYQVYSHSDFLKHFDVIEADHKDVNSIGAAAGIRLVCKGIKKFRPREGFYPAQRTLQLAQLFSQSYGPHIDYSGPTFLALSAYSSLAHDSFRTFLQPFFAPGILYNTIKSGVAVDYPIKRVSEFSGGEALFVNPGTGSFRSNSPEKRFCVFPDFTVDAPRSCAEDSPWEKFVDSSETEYFQEARYTGRIPFEAILEPEKFVTDTFIRDNEVHTASLIACDTRLVDAPYSPLYKMATNNFFAETANFYLKNKGFAAMTSRSDRDSGNLGVVKVGGDFKEYQMDVVLTNMAANTVDDVVNYGQWDRTGPEKSIVMYDRSLAFGPGCLVTSSWEDNWVDPDSGAPSYVTASIVETSPFTPPYYGGYAKIRLKFKPTKFDYTIPELIGELTSSCFRAGHWEDPATATGVGILDAMQITASINILDIDKCLISDKLVEYAEDGTVQTVKEDPNAGNIWVIEPKFETPVLDFKYVDVTRPTEFEVIGPAVVPATGSSGRFSVPKGMWHQYGQIPSGSEGIFLQIKDVSNSEVDDEFLTGSLADLVGFDKGRRNRRIGELPFDLSVSEAVVAVPFYEGADEEMQFLPIHRTQISNAKDELAGQLDPMSSVGNSIVQMVKRMQKYVFPPKMDFLKYENVEPFAMYIFEFTHTFSRQDLADMWQNLSPKIGTEFQAATSTIQHKILEKELVDQNQISGGGRGGNLRWLVFKVKQKAKTNYYEMTLGGATLADRFNIDLPGRFDTAPDFSYNWPYDYFSLVELVKLDAEVEYMKKETNTETLTGPAGETLTTES